MNKSLVQTLTQNKSSKFNDLFQKNPNMFKSFQEAYFQNYLTHESKLKIIHKNSELWLKFPHISKNPNGNGGRWMDATFRLQIFPYSVFLEPFLFIFFLYAYLFSSTCHNEFIQTEKHDWACSDCNTSDYNQLPWQHLTSSSSQTVLKVVLLHDLLAL